MEYYPLKIEKKVQESKDSYSFYFSIPKEHEFAFVYRPAQFLTFKFNIDGKDYVRSYSIASSSFANEILQTSVKRVQGGIVSNYMIDNLKEGDEIFSQKPLGEFFTPPKTLEDQTYVLFAAGIGITPLISILKTVLVTKTCKEVILIYSNREQQDIIYNAQLEDWKKSYPDKLKIHNVISKKEGRLDASKISHFLNDINLQSSLFYLCGPKDYMSFIEKTLQDLKISEFKIFKEDFNVVPILGPKPDEDSVFFESEVFEQGAPETLEANIYGENIKIPMNSEKSLLEQLLDEGHEAPFSCTSGSCMTCMAKLKEGKVFQLDEGILDEDNIKALEILTCQCYPLSKKVVIDYEDL